jgi:hypothetical protein
LFVQNRPTPSPLGRGQQKDSDGEAPVSCRHYRTARSRELFYSARYGNRQAMYAKIAAADLSNGAFGLCHIRQQKRP